MTLPRITDLADLPGVAQITNAIDTGVTAALAAALLIAATYLHRRRSIFKSATPRPRPKYVFHSMQALALILAVAGVAAASEISALAGAAATAITVLLASRVSSTAFVLEEGKVRGLLMLRPTGDLAETAARIRGEYASMRSTGDVRRLFGPLWPALGFGLGHAVIAGAIFAGFVAWPALGFFPAVAICASLMLPGLSAAALRHYKPAESGAGRV
jgi:hypothetical protein